MSSKSSNYKNLFYIYGKFQYFLVQKSLTIKKFLIEGIISKNLTDQIFYQKKKLPNHLNNQNFRKFFYQKRQENLNNEYQRNLNEFSIL